VKKWLNLLSTQSGQFQTSDQMRQISRQLAKLLEIDKEDINE
jgi:hypothetical protein